MSTAPHSTDARQETRRTRGRCAGGLTAAMAAVALAVTGVACASGSPGPAVEAPAGALTAAAAARLADRVPAPVLHWATCRAGAQCATAELPLNYRDPRGAKVRLALLRIRAADPRHRLGTIFVNPGGPGDSARDLAAEAPQFLPKTILDRFDIVGVDPRGVDGSTPLRCFATKAEATRTLAPFIQVPFPDTAAEQRTWVRAAEALGRACSTAGRPIAAAMSTTDDALDMDVLRRAVGDRTLTYVGESYGTYLGLVYANIFPSRVRAMVLDGVVDPQAWAGTPATAAEPLVDRMGSATASYRVLRELLLLCQRAGKSRCTFADGDTQTRFARLAAGLRARPLQLAGPGRTATTFTYANLVADTSQWLRQPSGYQGLFAELTDLARLTARRGSGKGRAAVVRSLLRLHGAVQPPPGYASLLQTSSGVLCTDGLQAEHAASWPAAAVAADRQARYFGADLAWTTVQCAGATWTAQDRDVYRGPFDHRTAGPVLVIGAVFDPVTSYGSAVKVERLLPHSRLIASDSWGHTALLTSACVDNATWNYLIDPLARAPRITHCRGDVQPFTSPASTH